MSRKDRILMGIILAAALISWLMIHFLLPGKAGSIRISVDGELLGEYSLDEEQEIFVPSIHEGGAGNVVWIHDGRAKMKEADCPDQLCVHQKSIDSRGGTIICLPNRVVVEGVESQSIEEHGVDAVAG